MLHFPTHNRLSCSVELYLLNFPTPLRDVTDVLNSNTETLNILIKLALYIRIYIHIETTSKRQNIPEYA